MAEQMDQDVINLAKAIRKTESNNNYNARGGSGEMGAYQWMPNTWKSQAKSILGDENAPMSQDNQNAVAYVRIKQLKDQGYNPAQIAAIWNSGSATNWEKKVGTNKYGQHYDVPAYVKKVTDNYQSFKSDSGQYAGLGAMTPKPYTPTYVAPVSDQSQQQAQQQTQTSPNSLSQVLSDRTNNKIPTNATDYWKYVGGKTLGFLGENIKKGLNFAFPVAEDIYKEATGTSNKSVNQELADLGMSALMFTGIGEASKGAGLMSKIIKSAPVTGYGIGTLNEMSTKDKNITEALTPNASNLIGAFTAGIGAKAIPSITSSLARNFSKGGALNAIEENIGTELSRTSSGRTLMSNLENNGQKAIKTMIMSGAIPEVEGNHFAVDGAIAKLENNISQLGQARAAALDKSVSGQSLDDLGNEIKNALTSGRAAYGGEAQATIKKIDSLIEDIHQTTGKNFFTTSELETMKEQMAANSKIYKRNGSIGDSNAASLLSDALRNKIEDISEKSGFSGMKEYNSYMKDNYDAIKLLEKLGNQTVKGGRLGNMLKGKAMGLALSSKSSGMIPTIMSMMLGDFTGEGIGKILSDNSISNPLRDAIISKMEKENPQIVQQLLEFTGNEGQKVAQQYATGKEGLIGSTVSKAVTGINRASPMLTKEAQRATTGIANYIPH